MKKSILITFLSTVAFFIACDPEKEEFKIKDDQIFHGEWCHLSSDGIFATDITFEHLNFIEDQYSDISSQPNRYARVSGRWSFVAASNTILLEGTRTWIATSAKEPVDESYVVVKQEEWLLDLRNQSLGSVETYRKVLETKNLSIGQAEAIERLSDASIKTTSLISSNEGIAKIGTDGSIIAVGSGTAFVTVSTNLGVFIVKIVIN